MTTRSIAIKLSVIPAISLAVTVLALTIFAAVRVRQLTVDHFNASSAAQIRRADDNLSATFGTVRDNVTFLSASRDIESTDSSITNYLSHTGPMTPDTNGGIESQIFSDLKRYGETHPDSQYVAVGTIWGGYVQWPKLTLTGDHYDPRERPWYSLALQSGDGVQRTQAYETVKADKIISFVRKISDPNGKTVGILAMGISLNGFAKMVNEVRFGKTGYLVVVEGTGTVLVDPHNPANAFKQISSLGDGYRKLADVRDGTVELEMGDVRYSAIVYTSPNQGWKYIALIPHSEIVASADRLCAELAIAGLLVAAIALTFIVVGARTLTAPIREISARMKEISSGDGDLTQRLPATTKDEIGGLARNFNEFVDKLKVTLLSVRESSHSLHLATGEISAGNADLSSRTEQQAAALEETAASMEELTSAVENNATNALEASAVAQEASDTAQRSSGVVDNVVDTMSALEKQAAKIADITSIIEGIAFQTNILALNAAVESARAGAHGRGFAVVANEVRSLAQRCSSSAKEIAELVNTSVRSIHSGSELARNASESMNEVIASSNRVATIVKEIADASDEQSRGIAQVNLAITQMDDVTQQNAALVEQAAAAARSLDDQSRQLNSAVSAFRLE